MIKVTVHQIHGQEGWYIRVDSAIGVTKGKISYKTKAEALAAARRNHPYVSISVE
jgi:hypothetical protein